jgi:hypothetical protein
MQQYTIRQYTALYYSNHKYLHVSGVQGSYHQAVSFGNVKEENLKINT